MGLSTTVVLVMSNLLISAFRKVIPNGVRMPAYIVIVASLVTVVQFIMQAYTPILIGILRSVYSTDRCKLYHPWKGRELCIQKSGHSICI